MRSKIRFAPLFALLFLPGLVTINPSAAAGGAQAVKTASRAAGDIRKEPGFDPRKFAVDDLSALLKGKSFSDGRHLLEPFADGTRLSIETKQGKIRRAFLVEKDGAESEATIHSPAGGTPTVRSFTVGVHVKTPVGEVCFICTIGRDSQANKEAATRERRKLIRCHSAPCDDFYPEPDPPQIDPLKR